MDVAEFKLLSAEFIFLWSRDLVEAFLATESHVVFAMSNGPKGQSHSLPERHFRLDKKSEGFTILKNVVSYDLIPD